MDVITAVCTEHQPGGLDGWYPVDGGQGVPTVIAIGSIGSASIGGASFFNGDGGGGSGFFRSNDRTTTIGFDLSDPWRTWGWNPNGGFRQRNHPRDEG